jgi:hypothetical protein
MVMVCKGQAPPTSDFDTQSLLPEPLALSNNGNAFARSVTSCCGSCSTDGIGAGLLQRAVFEPRSRHMVWSLEPGRKTTCCIDTSRICCALSNQGDMFAMSVNIPPPPPRQPTSCARSCSFHRRRTVAASIARSTARRRNRFFTRAFWQASARPTQCHECHSSRCGTSRGRRSLLCAEPDRSTTWVPHTAPVVMVAADEAKFWPAVISQQLIVLRKPSAAPLRR